MDAGVTGSTGMTQAFPPNTGVGWFTMATSWSTAEPIDEQHYPGGRRVHQPDIVLRRGESQADTIADAARSAPARRWPRSTGSVAPHRGLAGPIVDFTNFFTNRGVLAGQADPVEAAGSAFFGVNYQDANSPRPDPEHLVQRADRRSSRPSDGGDLGRPLEPPRTRTAPTTCTSTTASSVAGPPMTT